ncbi:hypothetical protein G6M50_07605 [Agrobacterium rhizogenes]|nr:hypothetical protein [Rhizobium rhizogenes]NTJ77665.1 hypothetical protein [Rhizobium rhizogenes]
MKTKRHKLAREEALAVFYDNWELLDRESKRRAHKAFDKMITVYLEALNGRICLSEAVGFMYPRDIERLEAGRLAQIFAGKQHDRRFIPVFSGDPSFIDTKR